MRIFERFRPRFRTAAATAATVIALGASIGLAASPSGASTGTVTWTGNGTNAGLCGSTENIGVTVPAGQQAWLFILTSPGNGPYTVTTSFSPAGDTSTAGAQMGNGNGAVHFVVFTPLGATLNSASALTGTDHSVLTVSGCQDGAPAPTTPTTTTTTTTTPPTTTTTTDPSNSPPTGTTPTTTPPSSGTSTSGGSTGGNTSTPSNSSTPNDGGTVASTASPTSATKHPANESGLAFTGADISGMVAAALALLGIGAALILLSRTRRRVSQGRA